MNSDQPLWQDMLGRGEGGKGWVWAMPSLYILYLGGCADPHHLYHMPLSLTHFRVHRLLPLETPPPWTTWFWRF